MLNRKRVDAGGEKQQQQQKGAAEGANSKQKRKKARVVAEPPSSSLPPKNAEKLQKVKQSIDELFTKGLEKKKERAKQELETEEKEKAEAIQESKRKQEHVEEERNYSDPKVHRIDAETGLPVYKYFDLGMAIKGSGYTPDCPFDCNCCH